MDSNSAQANNFGQKPVKNSVNGMENRMNHFNILNRIRIRTRLNTNWKNNFGKFTHEKYTYQQANKLSKLT